MTARLEARRATEPLCDLAEGIVWDDRGGELRWVDIPRGMLYRGTLAPDLTILPKEGIALDTTISAVAPADDGSWLVAGAEHLLRLEGDDVVGRVRVLDAGSGRRLNDGTADRAGRYLVGSVSLAEPHEGNALWSWEPTSGVRVVRNGIRLSNGIGFAPDGMAIYHVDSRAHRVDVADYDPASGRADGWRVLLKIDDGQPDGLAVDAEGCLWVAVWGAGRVRRFDPGGALLAEVHVDAPRTSSVAFAGPELDVIVITTAREPDRSIGGALYTLRVPVAGLPVARVRAHSGWELR